MFEAEPDGPNPVAAYLAQLFLVPAAVGLVSVPFFAAIDLGSKLISGRDPSALINVLSLPLLFGIGLAIGRFVRRMSPGLASTGIWLWAPPVCLLLISFAKSWAYPLERAGAFSMYLGSPGSDEGLTRVLITGPVVSLVGYALGIQVKQVGRR
jgi:hypothetical protein